MAFWQRPVPLPPAIDDDKSLQLSKPRRGARRPKRQYIAVPRNPAKAALYPNAVVSAGGYHTAVVAIDGSVWTFGEGLCGQLGHPPADQQVHPANELLPRRVQALADLHVVAVSCGLAHTAFLVANGTVFTCGFARSWLGNGDWHEEEYRLNVHLPAPVESLRHIERIACGWSHTLALQTGGVLYSWGDGADGRLGHGHERDVALPLQVEIEESVCAIAAGAAHSAAVLENGAVYTWGTPRALGHGRKLKPKQNLWPTEVEHLRVFHKAKVTSVSCGASHTVALDEDGKVYTWGWGQSGQLGHGNREDRELPSQVYSLKGKPILRAVAGPYHTVVTTREGELLTFGAGGCSDDGLAQAQEGEEGRLGHGQYPQQEVNESSDPDNDDGFTGLRDVLSPKPVVSGVWRLVQGYRPKHLAAGGYHTVFTTEGGRVYCCGVGAKGRLGLGNEDPKFSPTFVEALRDVEIAAVAVQDKKNLASTALQQVEQNTI